MHLLLMLLSCAASSLALTDSYYYTSKEDKSIKNNTFDWVVIGAGPAGITAIGVLLDAGVDPETVMFIDEAFNVGRLGQYYANVPSNTKTRHFIDFLTSCKSFCDCKSPSFEALKSYDMEIEPDLKVVIDPLIEITTFLLTKVHSLQDKLIGLHSENSFWHLETKGSKLVSRNVVLATGSHPKDLNYSSSKTIPLDIALDCHLLKKQLTPDDTVCIVGSSHSAILLLKYLSELNVKKIINLYTRPISYAVDMGSWTFNNAAGLKGATARWAKEVLEKNPPAHLIRLVNSDENRKSALDESTKVIYAVGYERNELPVLADNAQMKYDEKTGVIAPGLFGIGIAFPERYTDPLGNEEYRVGVNSFMSYAQRVIPQWIKTEKEKKRYLKIVKQHIRTLSRFDDLFTISVL